MLTVDSVFSRVGTALASLSGWRPTVRTFEAFPSADGGAERDHKTYAIATPATRLLQGRQGASNQARTDLVVRYLYRIRPTDRDTDYAAALVAEAALRAAVLGTTRNPELRVQIPVGTDAIRRELPSGTGPMLLGELPFVVFHSLPLA